MTEDSDFLKWLLGLVAALLGLVLWSWTRPRYRLPPGPRGLPLIGYFPFLGRAPEKKLQELSKKYGSIIQMYLGRQRCVFLNDFNAVKEAFNNPHILNRPTGLLEVVPDGLGLLSLNGQEWVEQRRYSMKALKDVGLGKSPWEDVLEEEVADFVSMLTNTKGQPVDILEPLIASLSNNIVSILLSRRLLQGDPLRTLVDRATESINYIFSPGGIITVFPKFIKFLSDLGLTSYAKNFRVFNEFNRFLRSEVNNRKSVPATLRNEDIFIDGYLSEIDKTKGNSASSSFSEQNLVANAQALIVGGSETGTTSLRWLLLAMAAYPDVQERVHAEVERVLGRDGHLKYLERNKLPYTYATILEGQRWKTVVPLGVPRRTIADTTIGGFDIPADSIVFPNIYALHNDPKYWTNFEEFDSSRFLNEDGTLVSYKPPSYIPFSIGRRSCPGETIALMEIFHYFTSILQNFQVRAEKDGVQPNLEGILEATFQPHKQKLRFIPR